MVWFLNFLITSSSFSNVPTDQGGELSDDESDYDLDPEEDDYDLQDIPSDVEIDASELEVPSDDEQCALMFFCVNSNN